MEINVHFSGGMELLFDNQQELKLNLPETNSNGTKLTVKDLIHHLADNVLRERPELFILEDSVRPGILVLINEVDWELEGQNQYELNDKDTIVFISTLHGG